MERVLRATEAYLPDAPRQAQLKQLGYHLLANFVVRNADCHSKNIALYYTSLDDIAFTPVYDLVTTQAYDGFRDSAPGLSIEGRQDLDSRENTAALLRFPLGNLFPTVFADARGIVRLGRRRAVVSSNPVSAVNTVSSAWRLTWSRKPFLRYGNESELDTDALSA